MVSHHEWLESPGKEARKQEQISAVEKKIETRPDQTQISEQILNPTGANRRLSGNLAQTARALERKITADKLDRHLVNRPDAEDLPVIDTSVSAAIQGVQRQLQRQMNSDSVSHMLEKRPDVEELKGAGVLQDGKIAPGLQATQHKLERQMNADQVHQLLATRPTQQDMIEHGIIERKWVIYYVGNGFDLFSIDGQVAPSLVATARALERNLVHDQVQHLLETRPEPEELAKQNIFGGMVPVSCLNTSVQTVS